MESKTTEFIDKFGARLITPELLEQIKTVTNSEQLHPFLSRGFFYAHRDLEQIIKLKEENKPFYLYTGRGPSSTSLHLGHLIPFMMTAYLQRLFDVKVVIQLTDDEKFLTRDLTMEEVETYTRENLKDIMACGFDPDKTFIFRNSEYIGKMYRNICRIQRRVTLNQITHIFGIEGTDHMGKVCFPVNQMAPCFPSSFPDFLEPESRCLVVCGIDQDPYFRPVRDIAESMKEKKPALIYSGFLPSLFGPKAAKMSASDPNGTIYLNDTPKQVKKKINRCFSGGGDTLELHRKNGANLAVDVPYQYLKAFHANRELVEEVALKYSKGEMLTGEVKKLAIEMVNQIIQFHQERRDEIASI